MRGKFRYGLLFLVLALFVSGPGATTESAPAPAGVDLAKTRELYESWILRKSFPDSITLAYYSAYSLQALQGSVAPEVRERLLVFIKSCQRDDGGFVSNPKFGTESNVVFTYYGLAAVHLLGADIAVDRDKATDFVRGLLQPDGAIRPIPGDREAASLASTFFGVQSLRLLDKLDLIDRPKTKGYVLAHRTEDGGFGVTTKGSNSPRAVSMAVRTLADIGELDEEVKKGAVRYLENAIALLGTRGPKFRALSSLQAAADIVAALERMGVLQEVITDPLLEFVTARYVAENGGFGPAPGLGTAPPSTYEGIYCLATLGKLGRTKAAPEAAGPNVAGGEPK